METVDVDNAEPLAFRNLEYAAVGGRHDVCLRSGRKVSYDCRINQYNIKRMSSTDPTNDTRFRYHVDDPNFDMHLWYDPRPDFDTTFWIKDTCIEPSHSRHIGIGDIAIANRWAVLRFVNLM